MKKIILISLAITILLFAASAGCEEITIKYYVPDDINLTENELAFAPVKSKYQSIEVVIYYYSESIERLAYNENSEFSQSTKMGGIKSLVKLKKGRKLAKVLFVEATGESKTEIIKNFHDSLKKII